jgi:hypothetical protein
MARAASRCTARRVRGPALRTSERKRATGCATGRAVDGLRGGSRNGVIGLSAGVRE